MNEILETLKRFLSSTQETHWKLFLPIVPILVVALIGWWVFNSIVKRFQKKYHDSPLFENNETIFNLIRRTGHYAIIILTSLGLLRLFHAPILEKIVYASIIILLCMLANSIISLLIPLLQEKLASKTETGFDDVILDMFKKFSGIIIFGTGIIIVLDVIGVNIVPFIAGAGIVGIAIGLAAKDTLSNLVAGIVLIIDRPFEVGDRIEVWEAPANSATWGDVIDIGLRATKIQTTDKIIIIIPNNEIMKRDIINYTTITKEIRVRIPIGIAYDADVKRAKKVIVNIGLELDWVMHDPPPKVVVRSFGDSAVNLEARVWINEPRKRMDTISHVTDRVKEVFQEEGIEIPFPKRDIYIKKYEPQ